VKSRATKRKRRAERGYALLLAAFICTLMLITVMTAAPRIKTMRQREEEKEMIWRGNQYVRGIKMYFRKTGKYPTSLEDLTKPQIANVHFMRKAYKDPMNKEDGSWRLLYVGPNGLLVGSLKPVPPVVGTAPAAIPGAANIGTPAAGMPGTGINGQSSMSPIMTPGIGSAQNAGQGTASTDTDANGLPIGAQATEPQTIIGGNIIGVGSKAFGRSVIVWDKATNYRLFEFYWDPSKDTVQVGAPSNIPGTSNPGTPAGMQPGTNPGVNPGLPTMNPGGTNNPPDPSGPPTQAPPQQ
jgi:hypothetical protein